jgi:hypothetical protein
MDQLTIRLKLLVLVGGFGDSPYLRKELRENVKMEVFLANDESGCASFLPQLDLSNLPFNFFLARSAKAVSDGALIWHLKQSVTARFTRFAYGTGTADDITPEEARRLHRPLMPTPMGDMTPGGWSEIVPIACFLVYSGFVWVIIAIAARVFVWTNPERGLRNI